MTPMLATRIEDWKRGKREMTRDYGYFIDWLIAALEAAESEIAVLRAMQPIVAPPVEVRDAIGTAKGDMV